jgi:hypothetical protein
VRRWALAAGIVLAYLYPFPYFAELRSANEMPRIYLTQEIVDHGSFRLDARWAELQRGSTFDVSVTPRGRYANKAPGASFLAIPAYLALKAWHAVAGGAPTGAEVAWAFRVTAATLPALLFLPLFLGLARRFTAGAETPARTALVAYALGSLAYPYALLFYSHALAAACAGGAFAVAVELGRGERRPRWALAVGLLAGVAVLADYQAIIAAAAVGVYLLLRAPRRAWLAALGAVPPLALLAIYHQACFGSPFRTGYSFAPDPAHRLGFLGIVGPNATAFWQALLAPDNGLVTLMPWVLLAMVGAVAILRDPARRRAVGAEAVVCAAVAVAYIVFLGSLVPEFGRGGWSVGPRYLLPALPFLGWLAAAGLAAAESRAAFRVGARALVLVGVVIYVVAASTYPHWPTAFPNPLYQVSFRLLGAGMAPHSLGTLVGLRGLASLAPLYALVVVLVFTQLGRVREIVLALLLAAAVVAGYRGFTPSQPVAPERWQFIERTFEPR